MKDAVIVSAVRTAVGRAPRGTLNVMRPDEMAGQSQSRKRSRARRASMRSDIDDVILGCAMPEGEQGLNVARIASLRAGIPIDASAVTVNRFCSSGLQAIAYGAERIMLGQAQVVIGGGTESMSLVPMGGNKVSPNPTLVESYPDVYLSTGLVAENHARLSQISRDEQDAFALRSHQRAVAAIDAGRFKDEIAPLTVRVVDPRLERRQAANQGVQLCGGRRAAPRDVSRGAWQTETGVSRVRHRHRRQFVADQRRRRGRGAHVRRLRRRSRIEAACAIRDVRNRRCRAGAVRRSARCPRSRRRSRRPGSPSIRSTSSS